MSDEMLDDVEMEDESPEQEAPEQDSSPEEVEQPEPQEAAPQPTVWDAFKSLPDFQGADERAIAQRLYQSLEREKQATRALAQYREVLPYTQQYLQDRPEYEKWRASQNAPAAPQQVAAPAPKQEEQAWWNPPQVRDAYKRYIVKDESGRDTIHPDAPIDAKHALTEYFQYRQDFAEKFLSNPEDALAPMVSRLAQQQAQQIVSQQLEQAGRQQYIQTLEEQNKDWLYSDPVNKISSKEGEAAKRYIEQAAQLGISSPEARWQFALEKVERDLLHQVLEAQAGQARQQSFASQLDRVPAPARTPPNVPPQRTQAEANMEYLRRAASRTANRAGVQTNNPEAGRKGMSFEERLRADASDAGLI
jgi:hypothetical protein